MKDYCVSCGRHIDNNEKYFEAHANYCLECDKNAREMAKLRRGVVDRFKVYSKPYIPKGEVLHEFVLDKRFR